MGEAFGPEFGLKNEASRTECGTEEITATVTEIPPVQAETCEISESEKPTVAEAVETTQQTVSKWLQDFPKTEKFVEPPGATKDRWRRMAAG